MSNIELFNAAAAADSDVESGTIRGLVQSLTNGALLAGCSQTQPCENCGR